MIAPLDFERPPRRRRPPRPCDCGACEDCAFLRARARLNGETPNDVSARDSEARRRSLPAHVRDLAADLP